MFKEDTVMKELIDNAIIKYTVENINNMKNEINQYKITQTLDRFNNSTNISCSECVKYAIYINNKRQYLCWYHGFIVSKKI